MGVDMFLESSQTQASETQTLAQSLETAYVEVQSAIQSFTADTDSLKGKAYDSARSYYSELLLPLAQGGELLAIAVSEAVAKLPSQYEADVDSRSWTQDELERKIAQEQEAINMLDDLNQSIRSSAIDSDIKSDLLHGNAEMVRGHHANKRAYEQILSDLLTFDATSATFFEEALDLLATIRTGLSAISDSWDSSTGTFKGISDTAWATTLSAKYELKDLELSKEERAFVITMMTEYGFDVETARQLLAVKQGIDSQFADYTSQERDYIFLRLIGAVSYGGVKWDETAGYLSSYFYDESVGINNAYTDNMQKVPMSLLEIFQVLGLSEQEAKELTYNLRLQHEMAGGTLSAIGDMIKQDPDYYEKAKSSYTSVYGSAKGFDDFWDEHLKTYSNNGAGNMDFTHQSITMATHLNPSGLQLADFYGGREHVKALAGWEGDTTYNANDEKPSIGEDDYKADLDAVNIVGRMAQGQSYMRAMNGYYSDVTKDETVREKEFLKNEGWDKVKGTIYGSLAPIDIQRKGEEATRDYISEHYEDVSKFLSRLEAVGE